MGRIPIRQPQKHNPLGADAQDRARRQRLLRRTRTRSAASNRRDPGCDIAPSVTNTTTGGVPSRTVAEISPPHPSNSSS